MTWRAALLIALLTAHLGVRIYHTCHQPASMGARHDYNRTYSYSLSLLLGRGFNDLPVVGTPAAAPLDDFLWLRRDRLSWDELKAYAPDPPKPSQDTHCGIYEPLASTRILDIHLTALLWRVFGISWTVFYVTAAVISTVCCFLIFLIGQRLGGGYWPGFLAATFYFGSPMEKFFSGWSIRDTSPLWFAVGAFCVLVLAFDRPASVRRYALGGLVLGFVATLGIGWRMDSLIIAPFVAATMAIAVLLRSRRVTGSVAACGCFGIACLASHVLVESLGPDNRQPTASGFHMAYYGDSVRANLLGIENSSQVAWCDMQTAMEARRYAATALNRHELLTYVSGPYGAVCRQMYFELLRNNAYRWTTAFPAVWWQSLRGHPDNKANYDGWSQYREWALDQGRPSGWPDLDFGALETMFPAGVPLLAILGALFAVSYGPQRVLAASLAIFTVYFAAITFAVLPMQKHMAMMLVPTSTFAGIGLWVVIQSLRPGWLRRLRGQITAKGIAWFIATSVSIVIVWGAACLVAHRISTTQRRDSIDSLLLLAERGENAPETLKGTKVFRASIAPGSTDDNVGYLLTIRAGNEPGRLQCSHRRVASAGLRPIIHHTTHRLVPGELQHFFVSCLQGSEYGDPRAYTCMVRIADGAEIVSSRRFNLASWDKLAVSTVFTKDDTSPGSPVIGEASTRWSLATPPVYARNTGTIHSVPSGHERILFDPPRVPDASAVPLTHLATFDRKSGAWQCLVSNGTQFDQTAVASWSPVLEWRDLLSGDFDGDGVSDIAGRATTTGGWWVTSSAQGSRTSSPFGGWSAGRVWSHVRCGDLNADDLDDVVGYSEATGQWWAALSDGFQFKNALWATWPADRPLSHVRAADFDGDGRSDLIGYDSKHAVWIAFLSHDTPSQPVEWNHPPGARPEQVCVGHFNGDRMADLAFLANAGRSGYVGVSNGSGFDFQSFDCDVASSIDDLCSGDFDGDGIDEVLICSTSNGSLLRGRHSNGGWLVDEFGTAGRPIRFLTIGEFDGKSGSDVAAFTTSGGIYVGICSDDRLQFRRWHDPIDPPPGSAPLSIKSFSAQSLRR